jgi:mono/diheme cytochrome c family protein
MKRILKYVLYALVFVIALAATFASFVYLRGIPKYEVKQVTFKVESTPERIVKGQKMVAMLCAGCHLNRKTYSLSGKHMTDGPPEFGAIHSANITQDPVYGIGKWTDDQIAYLFRTGLKPNGQYLPPYMPKLVHTSDEDIKSIIAFLRSNHEMVKAQAIPSQKTEATFLTKFLCLVDNSWKPFEYPVKEILAPDTNNLALHGEYLVNTYECFSCHSNNFATNNFLEPKKSKGYMAGGNLVYNLEGKEMLTKNITPDKETGIGNWTEEAFVTAMKTGKLPNGKSYQYPMLPYALLSDHDIKAIYAYIQTVPALNHKIPDNN